MTLPIFEYKVEAPSNIAFVKYWGKLDGQVPMNPSVSMTLDNCKTKTFFQFFQSEQLEIELSFEGKSRSQFEKRAYDYFMMLSRKYESLKNVKIKIQTSNNFPHSAGIASSASGFAAIAMGAWHFMEKKELNLESVSSLARLGSGSASRSITGPFCLWDNTEAVKIENTQIATLSDIIVLIDKGQKSLSSSAGHQQMEQHPYKQNRISNANENAKAAVKALTSGNFQDLGEIIEREALELHGLMMTSPKPFWLMKPMSLEVMNWIIKKRAQGLEAYFTLDAGANIHIISELSNQKAIANALSKDFPQLEYIMDQQGSGAVSVK